MHLIHYLLYYIILFGLIGAGINACVKDLTPYPLPVNRFKDGSGTVIEVPYDFCERHNVNLGNSLINEQINALYEKIKKHTKNTFLLEWEGSKIPQSCFLGEHEIGWTQHGTVTTVSGEEIGTYSRLEEWGGATKRRHKMVIWKS